MARGCLPWKRKSRSLWSVVSGPLSIDDYGQLTTDHQTSTSGIQPMTRNERLRRRSSASRPRRFSWRGLLRYRLRTLLLLVTASAIGFAWWSYIVKQRVRPQQVAVAELRRTGGAIIKYDFQTRFNDRPPGWPAWLVDSLGLDYFGNVIYVALAVDPDITDSQITHIGDLTQLQDLEMWRTGISDASLDKIAKLPRLSRLGLGETPITDLGLRHLEQSRSLKVLDLSRTKITDHGLESLGKMKDLGAVILDETHVTERGVADLQHALPNCVIYPVTLRDSAGKEIVLRPK